VNEGSECVEGREGKGRALGGAQGGEKVRGEHWVEHRVERRGGSGDHAMMEVVHSGWNM